MELKLPMHGNLSNEAQLTAQWERKESKYPRAWAGNNEIGTDEENIAQWQRAAWDTWQENTT